MADPNFQNLSEAEQRLVAERLLKIQESGWRPFWCPDPECSGMPHYLMTPDGLDIVFAAPGATAGPNGEPLGEAIWEDADGWYAADAPNDINHPLVGVPVLEPAWAHNHARQDQRLPSWTRPWVLAVLSGRGAGKTTTGVEFATLSARKGLDGAIIGRRGTELVNTHVRTILDRAHPEFVPEFQASKDLLVWPNGAITYLFSAERPENIRSVNLSWYWIDEAAHMDTITTVWMNVRLATRIEKPGNPIHGLITSTPVGSQWMMDLEDNPEIEIRRVSTYANKANLSEDFIRDLERDYEGTRMGRQELHGEVLRDVEGALWNDSMFTHLRVNEQEYQDLLDSMDDRVLAVDPSGSKGPRSDAHGIIGVGAQHTDDNGDRLVSSLFFVLGDATIKGSPAEMARQVFKAARLMRVNRIVVEKNFGGDHVKSTLSDWAKLHPEEGRDENGEEYKIELVHAVRSKETRAEPTVAKYEQARVKHVTSPTTFGDLSDLEKEQVNWVPKSRGGRQPSPNRVDALVWAVRAADTNVRFQATQASPQVLKKLKRGARV